MDLQPPFNQTPSAPDTTKPEKQVIRTMRADLERLSRTSAPAPVLPSRPKMAEAPEKLPVLPLKPLSPDLPPKKIPEKPKEFMAKKNRRGLKWLIGLIIVLFIGAGVFLYWWNYIYTALPTPPPTHFECRDAQCLKVEGEGKNQCLADADCWPKEPEAPESLIPVNKTETIEILIDQPESLLLEKIKTITSETQAKGALQRILIKLVNGEKKYASLTELISALNINIPEDILTNLKEYTLFFYSQPEGQRLGLIINISGEIKEKLTPWEKAMVQDLEPLFLEAEKKEPAAPAFQDNTYKNTAIRYLNLPEPSLSVDYALVNHQLVIAFSKEAMYKALDALFAQ